MLYVTLVHGTATPLQRFASWKTRRWKWLENCALVCELRNAFPDAMIDSEFRWSGANSIIARHRDSLLLRRYIRNRLAQYPKADHVIVAHSHGGTIAMKAASSAYIGHRLSAIVSRRSSLH